MSRKRRVVTAAVLAATVGEASAQTFWTGNPGFISSPTAALDIMGHLEVFAVWKDGALWKLQQTGSPTTLGWSAWQSLGHPPGEWLNGVPVVTVNGDGRLEVFVQAADSFLWHIWQNKVTINGIQTLQWSGWNCFPPLPVVTSGNPVVIQGVPALGRNYDGRLELTVRGTDNVLYHIWQTAPNSGWSGWWYPLGQGTFSSSPVVALISSGYANGCLEVFALGTDFPYPRLYHIWQLSPGGGWSNWTSLGGGFNAPALAVGQNQYGLEVFANAADLLSPYVLYKTYEIGAGSNQWSAFSPLSYWCGNCGNSLQIATNVDGRLDLFMEANSYGSSVLHFYQTSPDPAIDWTWDPYNSSLGMLPPGGFPGFAVGRNQDGRLEIFAVGYDGNLWHDWQVTAGGTWSHWNSQGQP